MKTADLKQFIVECVEASEEMRSELECHLEDEDADLDNSAKMWKRSVKKKISPDTLNYYKFLYEDYTKMFADEGMIMLPTRPLSELVGCIERVFLRKDMDALMGIITDPADEKIVAWFFQVD